jgi:hypothetical protein
MTNQYTKRKELITQKNRKEIFWNLINSGLAGTLILLGALTTGEITAESFYFALLTAIIVAVTQFKDYWLNEKKEYSSTKLFNFIKV